MRAVVSSAKNVRWRLTYSLTPPNRATPAERRQAIASAQSARVSSLPVDALLVYDVQDETARNAEPRPFPFAAKVDPLTYAFDELKVGSLPRVVYRAVAEQDESSLCRWLEGLQARGGLAVLVGAASRHTTASLTLPRAFAVCRSHAPDVRFGGVLIPERHRASGAEDARVWSKTQQGCGFFVSQTVWAVSTTKRLLRALRHRADRECGKVPPILLTFSPCGSPQTLRFQEWLGVEIPPAVKRELLSARDMLERSVQLAAEAYAEICDFASEQRLAVGCNVESVCSRAAEVDAAAELVHRIHRLGPHPGLGIDEHSTADLRRSPTEGGRTADVRPVALRHTT